MPRQKAKIRRKNFKEVALGYAEKQALLEAQRCLMCKKPLCVAGCPVEIDIPAFIDRIKKKDYRGAIAKIKEKSCLPAMCGRVCPQEDQCEKKCILGKKDDPVAIGRLERFAADCEYKLKKKIEVKHKPISADAKKIAIVGSGPSGLTAASELARLGYRVTIFEAFHKAGGVLVYGIPEFRLPKDIVQKEVDFVKSLGVEIKKNWIIGRIKTIDDLLKEGYAAVYVCTGAGSPYFMDIPGENHIGVYSASEFLTRSNLMKAYEFPKYDTPVKIGKKIAVVGGGNVAMDAARTALRLGAEHVYLVYRRSMKEMPAREEEVENAKEEAIEFNILTNPVEILGDKKSLVRGIRCIKMELGEPDASGRRRPIPIKGSEFDIEVDTVIMAIGNGANPLISSTTPDLEINKWGYIVTNGESGQTSKSRVYAGGDIVTGAATVILAMGAGKKAAEAIDKYIRAENIKE